MSARPRLLADPGALESLVPAWRDLAAAAGVTYFGTPDWVLAWLAAFGDDPQHRGARVAVWDGADGRLDAVVPLLATRQGLHPRLPSGARCLTVLGAGAGAADHCGFAVAPERADDVRAWFGALARRSTLWLPNLDPETGAAYIPPGARLVERTACPTMPADPEAIGSARFRKDLRYYARRLAAEGIRFRFVPPGAMDEKLFDALLGLHARRQETLGRATTFDAARKPFHLALIGRGARGAAPARWSRRGRTGRWASSTDSSGRAPSRTTRPVGTRRSPG
ncbi:hypothetical protein ACU686_04175 [Yinghuangia aomiensis]